jgi:hypothetical protein
VVTVEPATVQTESATKPAPDFDISCLEQVMLLVDILFIMRSTLSSVHCCVTIGGVAIFETPVTCIETSHNPALRIGIWTSSAMAGAAPSATIRAIRLAR